MINQVYTCVFDPLDGILWDSNGYYRARIRCVRGVGIKIAEYSNIILT